MDRIEIIGETKDHQWFVDRVFSEMVGTKYVRTRKNIAVAATYDEALAIKEKYLNDKQGG